MKRTFSLIACVVICCAMTASCKNNKTAEPTPEEIQAQKQALADTVLAQIDSLFNDYSDARSKSFLTRSFELTDAEKMVKPDYLLDPSVASTLLTKKQKINALSIYILEQGVRKLYDMPCDEVMDVIAKLAADVNFSIDVDLLTRNVPASEKLANLYNAFKESGNVAIFWQYQNAAMREYCYVLAKDPFFFDKITEDQYFAFKKSFSFIGQAVKALAPYDEEIKQIADFLNQYSEEEWKVMREECSTLAVAKETYRTGKIDFVAMRNALLQ